jgi:hypothetical protein
VELDRVPLLAIDKIIRTPRRRNSMKGEFMETEVNGAIGPFDLDELEIRFGQLCGTIIVAAGYAEEESPGIDALSRVLWLLDRDATHLREDYRAMAGLID